MGTYLSNLTQDDQVTLKGPLGPGLCIDSLSGNFLAISGGTGVIPFLDLVYYVWNNRNNPHQFKLTLYVSFRARKDVFIEDLLTATQNSVSENVFRLIIVISGEKNSNEIKDIMKDLGKESPKKAWVCGPSGFNRFVLDNLLESGLARKKIIIM